MPRDYKLIEIGDRDLNITYSGKKLEPPTNLQTAIDNHWQEISSGNKHFFNGEVYTIESFEQSATEINIETILTDFAYYIAIRRKIINDPKHQCPVTYSSVVIKTSDDYFIMAENGVNTAHPNRLQFIGGGIDNKDLTEDEVTFNIRDNAIREVKEELGLDINNAQHKSILHPPTFLKLGGNNRKSIGIIFLITTSLNRAAIRAIFEANNKKIADNNELIEIKELTFLKADISIIDEFEKTNTKEIKRYMLDVLRELSKRL